MELYYATPAPDRFVSEVRALVADGALDKTPARVVTGAFLGFVMRTEPTKVAGWLAELDDLRSAGARETLHFAAWISGTDAGRAFLGRDGAPIEFSRPSPDLLARPVVDPATWNVQIDAASGKARIDLEERK